MVANCDGCHIEGTKFVAKPSLRPTDKPRARLKDWSIDLITNIEPLLSKGYHHCIIAINCFSKWNEV